MAPGKGLAAEEHLSVIPYTDVVVNLLRDFLSQCSQSLRGSSALSYRPGQIKGLTSFQRENDLEVRTLVVKSMVKELCEAWNLTHFYVLTSGHFKGLVFRRH